jgi:PLD-like domain
MRRLLSIIALTLFFFLSCSSPSTTASTGSQSVAAPSVEVFFSPHGGATEAVIHELGNAKQEILVQAYSFTSAPIAKALVDAHKRGVKVTVVLDRSQRSDMFSTNQTCRNRPPSGLLPGPGGFPKKGSGVPFGELGWRVGEQEL